MEVKKKMGFCRIFPYRSRLYRRARSLGVASDLGVVRGWHLFGIPANHSMSIPALRPLIRALLESRTCDMPISTSISAILPVNESRYVKQKYGENIVSANQNFRKPISRAVLKDVGAF
jgi:hypothetical protein